MRKLNVAASSETVAQKRAHAAGGQAGVQGAAAAGVDVDAVALQPVGAGVGAFGDLHVDARLHEAVGQAQAADAAADDQDVEWIWHASSIVNQTDE